MKKISKFVGDFDFLSNFFEVDVRFAGILYPSSEAAFQAQKCVEDGDKLQFTRLKPSQAKRLGRRVCMRSDWEDIKVNVMTRIVRAKFTQHEVLGNLLYRTGDAELIEGNTWNDTFWGVCDGIGENHLGKILMQIRDELKEAREKMLERRDYYIDALDISHRCPTLDRYCRNLTRLAAKGKLPKCYARDAEIEQIQIALCRHTKPNIMLTGDTGCGKTAIVEGLAQKLEAALYQRWVEADDCIPLSLLSPDLPMVYELSCGDILGGAKYRGDFEERLQKIIHELEKVKREVILFIDEAHLLTTLGEAEGAVSAANLLKPALARGEFNVIAATTDTEFKEYLATDKALVRRFTRIDVKPIPESYRGECALSILNDYSEAFGIPYATDVDKDFLIQIVLGPMSDRSFPCEFVDTIDQMFAEAKFREKPSLNKEDFQKAVCSRTGCLVI